jgi:glutamyl-Q tRNA(Asp) synthetase
LPGGDPRPIIIRALQFLNQSATNEWQDLSVDDLLKNAVANWTLADVPIAVDVNTAFSNASR